LDLIQEDQRARGEARQLLERIVDHIAVSPLQEHGRYEFRMMTKIEALLSVPQRKLAFGGTGGSGGGT
jgi:hypothetical protein